MILGVFYIFVEEGVSPDQLLQCLSVGSASTH
jgi:hypothetical protein